jgi:hypothetical protein
MPINPSTYKDEQIILSSGRLVFNSRSENILLNSKQYISLSAGEGVNIDIGSVDSDNKQNQLLVNAPRIQFGLDRYGVVEPTVKGEQLRLLLVELINKIVEFNNNMSTIAITSPTAMFGTLYKVNASKLSADLALIIVKLDNFKSKTTFTI